MIWGGKKMAGQMGRGARRFDGQGVFAKFFYPPNFQHKLALPPLQDQASGSK